MAGLPMWTVYAPGTDGRSSYCARLWIVKAGATRPTDMLVVGDLESIRVFLREQGLACLDRQPGDEVNIIEVWL